jgi:hypothetical protein
VSADRAVLQYGDLQLDAQPIYVNWVAETELDKKSDTA